MRFWAIALMGPSGAGKGDMGERILSTPWGAENVRRVVSETNRSLRPGEHAGQYVQRTVEQMEELRNSGDYATFTDFADNRYAYRKSTIIELLEQGKVPLLDMLIHTLPELVERVPEMEVRAIFIRPSDTEVLLHRLINRDGDGPNTRKRYASAQQECLLAEQLAAEHFHSMSIVYNEQYMFEEAYLDAVRKLRIPELAYAG